MARSKNQIAEFERARVRAVRPKYVLQLFIAGATPQSSRALRNLRQICDEHLRGRYELEVIDVYQHPEMAREDRIIAVPTLLKKLPAPLRRFVGDFSDEQKMLIGLNLLPRAT